MGRPAVLVGHSLGGVVAWWVAQRHPELVAAAFLEDPPLYMGEPAEHERNGAVPIFRAILDTVARWKARGHRRADAAAAAAGRRAVRPRPLAHVGRGLCDDVPGRAGRGAAAAWTPACSRARPTARRSPPPTPPRPVSVPVFVLAADDEMGAAFPTRHAERLAITHPDVEIVRVAGAGHGIHDERDHRGDYVEALARFLAAHAAAG